MSVRLHQTCSVSIGLHLGGEGGEHRQVGVESELGRASGYVRSICCLWSPGALVVHLQTCFLAFGCVGGARTLCNNGRNRDALNHRFSTLLAAIVN